MGMKWKIFSLALMLGVFLIFGADNTFAADKQFTIQLNNSIEGAELSDHSFIFELQDPTNNNAILQTKTSSESLVSFDPITLDDQDDTSHFYRIVMKDTGEAGITYDKQAAYVRIVPKTDLLAYQKDNTYKYVNDGSGPHPYHATDEELRGQAYAEWDKGTKTLTFFRDEEGKYTNAQVVDDKEYFTGFEKATDNNSVLSRTWDSDSRDSIKSLCEKVVFRDAIRPEGKMEDWFTYYTKLETADISKLDTSKASSLSRLFAFDTQLQNIDVTKMDFSLLASSIGTNNSVLDSVLAGVPGVKEFDFNNYARISNRTNRFMPTMLSNSGLRYLNTTSLDHEGSSAEFSNLNCIEKIVVGPDYSFYRSNVDGASRVEWLKIETGEINSFSRLMLTAPGGLPYNPNSAGTYIRPTCRRDPITFESKYVKPASGTDTKNPNTADLAMTILAILAASCAGLGVVFVRKAQRR